MNEILGATSISLKAKLLIDRHPLYESLNKKLMIESLDADYSISGTTNVKAQRSQWSTKSPTIEIIQRWVESVITSHYNIHSRGYKFSYNGSWFVRYSKGDYTIPHDHDLSWMSWVYFINCPKGSSPLVLTDSGKRISAEEGKVVIFPGFVRHEVPVNKSDDRVALICNMDCPRR